MRALIIAACLTISIPSVGYAQTIKALVCEFTGRHTGKLDPKYTSASTGDKIAFTLGALDSKGQKAQMIGDGGASDVSMYVQNGQVQFVEFTASGNLAVTSVFISDSLEGNFAAVHSRHMKMLQTAIVSQYTGTCSARH